MFGMHAFHAKGVLEPCNDIKQRIEIEFVTEIDWKAGYKGRNEAYEINMLGILGL